MTNLTWMEVKVRISVIDDDYGRTHDFNYDNKGTSAVGQGTENFDPNDSTCAVQHAEGTNNVDDGHGSNNSEGIITMCTLVLLYRENNRFAGP